MTKAACDHTWAGRSGRLWTGVVFAVTVAVFGMAAGCSERSSRAGASEGHGDHDHQSEEHAGGEHVGGGDSGHGEDEHGSHAREGEHDGHGSHGGHGGHARKVQIPPETLDGYGIEVAGVETGRLSEMVTATAKVRHDVERVAHITPLVKGQISELHVSLGDRVEQGDRVATVRSVELGAARAAVEQTRAKLEVARANFERQKKLKELEIASEREFVEAKGALKEVEAEHQAARTRLKTYGVRGGQGPNYPLRAKISGTVIEQHASLGETKGSNDALFKIADQSRLWVIGRVSEKDINRVEEGMDAVVTLDAYPARSWTGTVDWVSSTVDEKTRLLPVRVVLENAEGTIKPGMFGTVKFKPASIVNPVPLVPVDAVQKIGDRDVVFVRGDKTGEFKPKEVETGAEADGLVEVLSGLDADAEIVTSGAFDLKAALTAKGRSAAHNH